MRAFVSRLAMGLGIGVLGAGTLAAAQELPKDIDAQSLSRLANVKRGDLSEEDKRIYDKIAGGEGKTATPTGPAAISLTSPKVAEAIEMLNQYLRFHGLLKPRDYEVAILVTAREFDQQYEWSGHEIGARRAGVPEAVIDAIKHGKPAEGFSDRDTLLINFARDSFHGHRISSELWAKAEAAFGKQGTLELATIIGDYAMAAIMLNAADQHLPAGREATLPVGAR